MRDLSPTLSQTSGGSGSTISLLIWAGVLVGVVMVLSAALLVVRKKMLSRDADDGAAGQSGLLAQLRAMHEQGKLSDDEYAAAKRRMAGVSRGAAAGSNPPRTGRSG